MKNIVLLAVLLCQYSLAISQWESLHGPFGGAIRELQNENELIFARTGNGVFRSTDGGRAWQHINLQIPTNYFPDKIIIQDTNVFLVCRWSNAFDKNARLFSSKDSGNTWIEIGTPPTETCVDFSFDRLGLYFNDHEDIWISTDHGISWRLSKINLFQNYFYDLYNYDDHVFILGLDKIYESGADPDTWNIISVTGIDYADRFYAFDSIYFALGYNPGLMTRSDDKGKTWKVNNHIDWTTSSLMKIGDHFFGNQVHTLIKSIDGGKTFYNTFIDLGTSTNCMTSIQDTMVLGTNSGILISKNEGSSFTSMNEGLDASNITSIYVKDNTLLALNEGIGISRLDLSSGIWQHVNYNSKTLLDLINVDNYTFALRDHNKVIRTSDNGNTWENAISVPFLGNYYVELFKGENSILVFDEYGSVDPLVSNDYGATWDPLMINLNKGQPTSYFNQNGINYIMTDYVIARSDHSNHWKVIKEIDEFSFLYNKLIVSDSLIGYIERNIQRRAYYLWVSQDKGENWKEIVPDFPSEQFIKGFRNVFFLQKSIIGTCTNGFMYASFDLGDSWVRFDDGMPGDYINEFTSDDDYIYAATSGQGVWRRKISDLNTVSTYSIPSEQGISVFPNPSNGNFTIKLDSWSTGNGNLVITDLSGKVCLTKQIVIESQTEVGTETLSSGLYFLTLQTGEKVYSSKIVINK